jgi:rRNA maturation endonuclease Nob1
MTCAELAGVRDAYTSATIDPRQPLIRCGHCQAVYHRTSLDALRADNSGGCAICGSRDLGPVTLADRHDA